MLNNEQKNYLKAYINKVEVVKFNIGKEALNNNVFTMLDNALIKHEIIKISFLKSSMQNHDKNQIILDILSKLNADLVQKIGNIIVIYRENEKLENRIRLPR